MRELDAVQTWSDPRYGLGYGPGYGSGCNPGKMLIDAASSFAYLEVLIEHSPIAIAVLDGEHRFAFAILHLESSFSTGPRSWPRVRWIP
jgi:hypothetical protein